MLTVLHVISGLKVGGAEMMLHRLILNSSPGEYRHVVAALDSEGDMRERFLQANVELHVFNFKRTPLREMWRLTNLIRNMRPAVVQTWLYHADLLGGIAARLAGCRNVIWGIRTTNVTKGGSRSIRVIRRACARLSHWIPTSIVCAAEAARLAHIQLGYCARRMVVISNGFNMDLLQADVQEVAALRRSCGFEPDSRVIGMLGRFNPDKDQRNFIHAAAKLARQYPQAFFLLVGRDCSASNAALMTWIAATGVPNRFVLLGERADVAVCLAAMDYFALPSRTEGFPNVLAEAMAMRRPCVSTDVGDAAVVLGDCGVLVPSEDATALAKGLSSLLDLLPEQLQELGGRAHARIAQEFSMATCVRRFEDVYRIVLNNQNK